MRKTALITGITGQDGSYLAELLLEKGYAVHGIVRRSSTFNTERIDHIFSDVKLHYGDMLDSSNLCSILAAVKPDEVYNLAAQSHVKVSFEMPEYTAEASGVGTLRLLEAIRTCRLEKTTRLYQASTSEMYGKVQEVPQKETTPFYPRSPYGAAKVYSYWIVTNYREAYDMYCVNGILFNHESPRRGKTFVTRKITQAIARIVAGKQDRLFLGNLDAQRDWGHAKDYVKGMWLMLQQEVPEDYVLATGEMHSVRKFTVISFALAGINLEWRGAGLNEEGVDKATGRVLVSVDARYFRPAEVDQLMGDATKARTNLGWRPENTLYTLAYEMLQADYEDYGLHLPSFDECYHRAGFHNSEPGAERSPATNSEDEKAGAHGGTAARLKAVTGGAVVSTNGHGGGGQGTSKSAPANVPFATTATAAAAAPSLNGPTPQSPLKRPASNTMPETIKTVKNPMEMPS